MTIHRDIVTVPGLVLEHALDDYRNRFDSGDIELVAYCGFADTPPSDCEDDLYDFDLRDAKQRAFLWIVQNEAEARVEALLSMIDYGNEEDYMRRDLRVFRRTAEKLGRLQCLCGEESSVFPEVTA